LISNDSIEEWIYHLQHKKTQDAHHIIPQEFQVPAFSRETLRDLLDKHLKFERKKPELDESQIPAECPVCMETDATFEAFHYEGHPHPLCTYCLLLISNNKCPICRRKP
jgi:hypothetical protein